MRRAWTFERAGGVAGFVAAFLMLSTVVVGSSPNEATATDERLLEFYGDSGNQYQLYVAGLLAVLAGLSFLWFLVVLRDRLSRNDPTGIPSLVFAAGLLFVVLWLVGVTVGTALPASLVYSAELELTEIDSLRVLLILGNHWHAGVAASTAALVVGGASFVARRHSLYARWLAWAGLVIALLMLPSMAAFAGFTLVGLMVWTAAVGVWLARGEHRQLTT